MTQIYSKARTTFAILLALLAGAEFLLRGPLRVTGAFDMSSPYVSSLRFLHKENPYPANGFVTLWHEAGAPAEFTPDPSAQRPVYPPTTLVVFAPFAAMRWPWAVRSYVWGCTLAYLGFVWVLSGLVGENWRSTRRIAFVAFSLAIAATHSGIDLGNVSILAFILSGFALYMAYFSDGFAAGVLAALAFCAKPTSAVATVLILLLCRRFKSLTAFACVCGAIAAVAAVVMSHVGQGWRLDYENNVHSLLTNGGAADFTSASPGKFDLVNLQVFAYTIFSSVQAANLLAIAATALLGVIWLLLFHGERGAGPTPSAPNYYWLAAGTLHLIALLPVYQRNYNAGVILFAAVWLFQNLQIPQARAAIAASAAFLVPGEAFLRRMGLDEPLMRHPPWGALVMTQLTWSAIAVILFCYACRWRSVAAGRLAT